MTTTTRTATAEDINMQRLCSDLFNSTKPTPSMADYAPLGNWNDLAIELLAAHAKNGHDGAKAFLVHLDKKDKAASTTLKRLLSSGVTQETDEELVGILLSDVTPESIKWLWKGYLALGKITMWDGDPGIGKSLSILDVAARLSTGRPMPDGSPCEKGCVVLITPEDGLADTIHPRLVRAGANLRNILSISDVPVYDESGKEIDRRPFILPDDLPMLKSAIKRMKAKLVIIDPLMSIFGMQNSYKDNEVRAALTPVKIAIEEAGAACVMVRHLTKGGGDNALYRGGGSIAFIGLARLALLVAKDPTDETRNVLAPIKSNIGKLANNLTYSVVSDEEQGDERPYIHWQGVNSCSVRELMSVPSKPGANRQEILRVLREIAPRALSPTEVWQHLQDVSDVELSNVTTTLHRMKQASEIISPARGLYTVSPKQEGGAS